MEYLVIFFIFIVLIIVGIIYALENNQNEATVYNNFKFSNKMLVSVASVAIIFLVNFFLVIVANAETKKNRFPRDFFIKKKKFLKLFKYCLSK